LNNNVVLKVENLQTKFRVGKRIVHAVNDVSFELKKGKMLGIVGESGCGKSVTAHSIIQLLPKAGYISNGKVRYYDDNGKEYVLSDFDRNGKEIRAVRGEEIAMIFQDPLASLDPVYRIGPQIAENLLEHENLSKKEAFSRVVSMLSELGFSKPEERYYDYPHNFSGGMKQRVMIAIAMICNPSILIADEPTTALDVTIQAQILSLMKKLQETHGTSTILITHNMGIIAETCDEVAVIYMGRIVEFGTIEQVFNTPLHPYTKALLKSVPVLSSGPKEKLAYIPGATPDGSKVFTGCAFEARCEFASDICRKKLPVDKTLDGTHRVQCWLYEKGNENG